MDFNKCQMELAAFSNQLQNAQMEIRNKTYLNLFNFKKFKDDFRKIKNPKDRMIYLENMIHSNHTIANEQAMTIENLLHEMKL